LKIRYENPAVGSFFYIIDHFDHKQLETNSVKVSHFIINPSSLLASKFLQLAAVESDSSGLCFHFCDAGATFRFAIIV
jgi:hypothetical protein